MSFQIGKVQMDAAVMNGEDLNYGGVMCIGNFSFSNIEIGETALTLKSGRHILSKKDDLNCLTLLLNNTYLMRPLPILQQGATPVSKWILIFA